MLLGVGDKEITEGRYDAQITELGNVLELLPLPAQEGGISATQVRGAIKILALGEDGQSEARALLERAFAYITDSTQRRAIIAHLIERWRLVDEAAQKAIAPQKKAS